MYRKTDFVTVGRGCRINSCICSLKKTKYKAIYLYFLHKMFLGFNNCTQTMHQQYLSSTCIPPPSLPLSLLFYACRLPLPITHIEIPSVFAIWEHSCQTFLSPCPTRGDISKPKRETGAWSHIYRLLAWETCASYIQRGV